MYFFFDITKSNGKKYATNTTSPKPKNTLILTEASSTHSQTFNFNNVGSDIITSNDIHITSCIENIAKWFLSQSSLSHKKLQKLCYYAYCWFIVFFNDIETVDNQECIVLNTICKEKFQAWIHGPVCPELYQHYKKYGWQEIPKVDCSPRFNVEIENLLCKVWEAYGKFSADQLESLAHSEYPWINARKGIDSGEACCNEISSIDILKYFSELS